jgi:hypothetical protein
MKSLGVVVCGFFLMLHAVESQAQKRWGITFKSGIDIPTEEFGGAELNSGAGGEAVLLYEITNFLSAYGGWSWNKFSAGNSFAGDDAAFEETGYTYGIQFNYPATTSQITYIVGIGGLFNHIEIEDVGGKLVADTKHKLGAQVETGILIILGKHLQLTPYGRYRTLSDEIEIDTRITPVNLNYLSAGIGLTWTF